MAITEVTTVTVDGVTIGLSDTIYNLIQAGEFTIANLQPYMIVGQSTVGNQSYASLSAEERNYTGSGGSTPAWFPVNNTGRLGNDTVEFQTKDSVTLPHVSYGRNILVHGTLETGAEPQQIRADNMLNRDLRVVTSIDFKKIYYDVEMSAAPYSYDSPAGSATYYQTGALGCVRTIDNDEDASCFVYSIFGDDDTDFYCIKDWMFPADDSTNNGWHMSSSQSIQGNYGNTYSSLGIGYTNFTTTKTMFRWINNQVGAVYGGGSWNWDNSGRLVTINGYIIQVCDYSGSGVYAGGCHNVISGLDNALKQLANAGLRFKWNNTWYKPISEGGIITGYTDDMTEESEWDDIADVTGNTVPVTPTPGPGPGPSGDDPSDDQASGGIYGGAQGMCNLYYMTKGEIKDLQNWFRGTVFSPGIQIPANFDPSNQLIGLMAFPIELGGSVDSTTITFRTADNQSVDTGVSCQRAYGDDLKFDMGTINIPARMQERGVPFLDYSSQIEVYIPFCDVVQLDVQQVIGTTLTCEMWINPATGDVSAMLSSGTHPVAYTSGNCAQQLPISVSSYGAIAGAKLAAQNKTTQAIFSAAQNLISSVTNSGSLATALGNRSAVNGQGLVEFSRIPQVQAAHGASAAMGISTIGGVVNAGLSVTAQNFDNKYALSVAKNSAPTHVSGSFGACTSWHFPNYCYVKITRPHFQKPDNYGHTEAVPVVATKKLSSLTGLTTCVNPDVSGIGTATMQELETIKSYLMSGVIL